MDLQEFFDDLAQKARENLEKFTELVPCLFVVTEDKESEAGYTVSFVVMPMPIEMAVGLGLGEMIRSKLSQDILAIMFVADGWTVKVRAESRDALKYMPRPSEHPDRQEAVICSLAAPDGIRMYRQYPYTREGDRIVWGDDVVDNPTTDFSGNIPDLLHQAFWGGGPQDVGALGMIELDPTD